MAIKRFTVPQTPQENIYFGSMAWRASFDGQNVKFINLKMTNHNEVILRNVKGGDMIGFDANGSDSKAFKVKKPIDQKYRILWSYGFTKPKRITRSNCHWPEWEFDEEFPGFETLVYRHYKHNPWEFSNGVLTTDFGWKYTTIKNETGKIMVASVVGRYQNSNNFIQEWYLSSDATLDHVKEWERKFNDEK